MDSIKKDPVLRLIRGIVLTEYRKMLKNRHADFIVYGPTNDGGFNAEIAIESRGHIPTTNSWAGTINVLAENGHVEIVTRLNSNSGIETYYKELLCIGDPDFIELLKHAIGCHFK